jgi:sugar (pentulose or hexulose) kinase
LSAKHYILSIDLGSSGPKVALVGDDGAIAASAVRPVRTIMVPPAGAEQDAEEIWSAILDAATQVLGEAGIPADSILGVATASQYFSIVPIDDSGLPVANLVLWLDGRGGPYSQALHERQPDAFERWVEINGMPPLPTGNDSLSHTLFIKNERPEIYERASKFSAARIPARPSRSSSPTIAASTPSATTMICSTAAGSIGRSSPISYPWARASGRSERTSRSRSACRRTPRSSPG